MKRFESEGLEAGARRPQVERRRGQRRTVRPLALSATPSPAAMRAAGFEGARQRDFEDFVEGDGGWSAVRRPHPDPSFREGLRQRLWRIHLMRRSVRGLARN